MMRTLAQICGPLIGRYRVETRRDNGGGPESSPEVRASHPNGHFYSPVVNPLEMCAIENSLWPSTPEEILGVDFNESSHVEILKEWFPRHIENYDYPEKLTETELDGEYFYTRNSQFSWLDSRALFVILGEVRPTRIVEVGSGYSSLLMADVNRRFLNLACHITCIEPYPREFLQRGVKGASELIISKVQETPFDLYDRLGPGDILFIDSSHVCKTGSDVNFLYFQVLPRLKPGVLVHVHDIFLPFEYPKEWVIEENRSWNEQYLVRALLMYSGKFRVMFSCSFAFHRFREDVITALRLGSGTGFGGGSLWMTVI
jgi:predicted O-methyltransferase YrrM